MKKNLDLNTIPQEANIIAFYDNPEKLVGYLQSLFAYAPGYISCKNSQSHYIWCNDKLAKTIGLKHYSEIVGRTDYDLAWGKKLADQCLLDDQYVLREGKILTTEYEFPIKRADGHYLHLRMNKIPLFTEQQNIAGILAIVTDVTDQKLAEKKVQAKNICIQEILYNLPGLIYWKNDRSQYMGFNKNVVQLSGLHREHLLGKTDYDLDWGRQQFEIPKPTMWITEYQAQIKNCLTCSCTTAACFSDNITHATQYGPRAKSLMVYMNQYQLIPFDRASQFFNTIYHQPVSPGTIVNAVDALSSRLHAVDNDIKQLLIQSKLAHYDETGTNINGAKQWLHTVGTEKLTHYAIHEKRGQAAMEAIGILPEFKGTLIHDHWKSYFTYQEVRHGLCNAHHLRELKFIAERQYIKWANRMSDLLLRINEHKYALIKQGEDFTKAQKKKYDEEYDDIIRKAGQEQARRGSIESHNLLKRLRNYKDCVLLFMNDLSVPFTSNLSEQDIRMMKVKGKISGCFRKIIGGDNFCKIRSVISTANKNKKNVLDILQKAFEKIITVDMLLAWIFHKVKKFAGFLFQHNFCVEKANVCYQLSDFPAKTQLLDANSPSPIIYQSAGNSSLLFLSRDKLCGNVKK